MTVDPPSPQAHQYLVALRLLADATEANIRGEITMSQLETARIEADRAWDRYSKHLSALDRQPGGWEGH